MSDIDQGVDDKALLLDDEIWEQLIELTDGAAAFCFQCGVCTATCPWGTVKQRPLSVRTLIRQAQLGLVEENSSLWLCTTCAQCETYCPRGVNIAEIFRSLRFVAWQRNQAETGLPTLLWSIYWNENPWSQPPSQRSQWAKNLAIPLYDANQHELLLYVGCTSSFDQRAQRIARALVHILRAADTSFGFLGDDEPCCGEAALSVGHRPYFKEVAEKTARNFQEKGVSQLVTISPHCYDVFKNHYPNVSAGFQPYHYTQYLADLLAAGRLKFSHTLDHKVTFQDPCYLGRINGAYQAPRELLLSVPGLVLVEMEYSAENGLCCGGGGGRMWLETPLGERFSDLRVSQAAQTGAEILVTACPFCVTCLEDSLKMDKTTGLRVFDLAEVLEQTL